MADPDGAGGGEAVGAGRRRVFSAAASLDPSRSISIEVAVTITPGSTFPSVNTPGSIALGWGELTYTPAEVLHLPHRLYPVLPANFEGKVAMAVYQQQGTAEPPHAETVDLSIYGSGNVSVSISGMPTIGFTPRIDPATNVLYGVDGTNFIVVSLSGPYESGVAQ